MNHLKSDLYDSCVVVFIYRSLNSIIQVYLFHLWEMIFALSEQFTSKGVVQSHAVVVRSWII